MPVLGVPHQLHCSMAILCRPCLAHGVMNTDKYVAVTRRHHGRLVFLFDDYKPRFFLQSLGSGIGRASSFDVGLSGRRVAGIC